MTFIITYAENFPRAQDFFEVPFADAAELAAYSQLAAFRDVLDVAGADWNKVAIVSIAQRGGERLAWHKQQWKYYFGPGA